MDNAHKGRLIVVSGPSGAGKDTVMHRVFGMVGGLAHSVSATTRQPRTGEAEGRDYIFLSREQFEADIRAGLFLEHATYNGELYGTPAGPVRRQREAGVDVVLIIEVQGAMQVRSAEPDCVLIFIRPPSIEDLEHRLRRRGTDTEEKIRLRLKTALGELECIPHYDYLVTNDALDTAVDGVRAIILAERLRVGRS